MVKFLCEQKTVVTPYCLCIISLVYALVKQKFTLVKKFFPKNEKISPVRWTAFAVLLAQPAVAFLGLCSAFRRQLRCAQGLCPCTPQGDNPLDLLPFKKVLHSQNGFVGNEVFHMASVVLGFGGGNAYLLQEVADNTMLFVYFLGVLFARFR